MNGPQHYRAAEDFIDLADNEPEGSTFTALYLAAAQAHGQLAEVAAFVEQVGLAVAPVEANHHGPAEPGNEWHRVIFGDQP